MSYVDEDWKIYAKKNWRKQVQLSFSAKELADLDALAALDATENKRRLGSWGYGYGYGKANRSETVKRLVEEELKRREKPEPATKVNGKAKTPAKKKATK